MKNISDFCNIDIALPDNRRYTVSSLIPTLSIHSYPGTMGINVGILSSRKTGILGIQMLGSTLNLAPEYWSGHRVMWKLSVLSHSTSYSDSKAPILFPATSVDVTALKYASLILWGRWDSQQVVGKTFLCLFSSSLADCQRVSIDMSHLFCWCMTEQGDLKEEISSSMSHCHSTLSHPWFLPNHHIETLFLPIPPLSLLTSTADFWLMASP